jgi:hypothetical protein
MMLRLSPVDLHCGPGGPCVPVLLSLISFLSLSSNLLNLQNFRTYKKAFKWTCSTPYSYLFYAENVAIDEITFSDSQISKEDKDWLYPQILQAIKKITLDY